MNADLIGGVDNISFDTRKFDPSRHDIDSICQFFSLGQLKSYKKEKNIVISHANFFIFVSTIRGEYALKFYPADSAKTLAIEYTLNRLLADQLFPTPLMHAGLGGQPFFVSNGRLVTCFSYIDGSPVCRNIKQKDIFSKINTAMLSLKNILSTCNQDLPLHKQENLLASITRLAQNSKDMASYDKKEMIIACLLDIARVYRQHQPLYTRQWLHNNTHLTNFLIYKKTIYTLDLSHIREDYALADLASLTISCLFFNVPAQTVKSVIKNYFKQHNIKPENAIVLNTLVKMGLIKEYLKNARREDSFKASDTSGLPHPYWHHLLKRKELIAALITEMEML